MSTEGVLLLLALGFTVAGIVVLLFGVMELRREREIASIVNSFLETYDGPPEFVVTFPHGRGKVGFTFTPEELARLTRLREDVREGRR